MTLVSLSELRDVLRLDPELDDQVELLRMAVVAMWEEDTGAPWELVTDDVHHYDALNATQTMLWLPRRPVASITKVEQRKRSTATWTTLATTAYVLDRAELGRVERVSGFWADRVRVTYTGGYDDTTCPRDVQQALLTQARFMVARHADEQLIVKSKSAGKGAVLFMESADRHPLFRRVAATHRRRF